MEIVPHQSFALLGYCDVIRFVSDPGGTHQSGDCPGTSGNAPIRPETNIHHSTQLSSLEARPLLEHHDSSQSNIKCTLSPLNKRHFPSLPQPNLPSLPLAFVEPHTCTCTCIVLIATYASWLGSDSGALHGYIHFGSEN